MTQFADGRMVAMDGNMAAATSAYMASEVIAIYPITPSSPMGELADELAARGKKNAWGVVPVVSELQSEGGASGSVHGALSVGALTTTFTASQGLLLMVPNMFKIAGELTPGVIHVSARSVACQALSIFGDHSDVMATRSTGFALLASNNQQEAHDFAVIATRASLESQVPFVHFFDGFRTSHEIRLVRELPDAFYREYIPFELVEAKRRAGMDPRRPDMRGTAQNPDIYFQGRESVNPYYPKCEQAVDKAFAEFARLTGRSYKPFEYVGHPEAEKVIVLMGSGCDTVEETVTYLQGKGEKVGVVKVRLYRPFSRQRLLEAIPASVKGLAVLDRTKEPGATGEPLYLDIKAAFADAALGIDGLAKRTMPYIIGGRYGLSSKEFTSSMVNAVFQHLARGLDGGKCWHGFSVGIDDDVSHMSLPVTDCIDPEDPSTIGCKFYGLGSDGTVGANKNSIKMIGECSDKHVQGYFVYDSKKAGAVTVSHLRFSDKPIKSNFLVYAPKFVAVHHPRFLHQYDVLQGIATGGSVLLNYAGTPEEIFHSLPTPIQKTIKEKKLRLYAIDAFTIAEEEGLGNRINTTMQAGFFKISQVLPDSVWIPELESRIRKSYNSKGEKVVKANMTAFRRGMDDVKEIPVTDVKEGVPFEKVGVDVPEKLKGFYADVIRPVMSAQGDMIPVSKMDPCGKFPAGTCKLEKRATAIQLPKWIESNCIQCNQCTVACPHATIVAKVFTAEQKLAAGADDSFVTIPAKGFKGAEGQEFRIQVLPDDCTGCGTCAHICPGMKGAKALEMTLREELVADLRKTEKIYHAIPNPDPKLYEVKNVKSVGLIPSHFEFSGACGGCGETPYVKMVSQLFGDHSFVANATGCSSIYGGTAPTSPYSVNEKGEGVAWSNSLFEDNAEYGYGMRLAADKFREMALASLQMLVEWSKAQGQNGDFVAAATELLAAPEETEFQFAAKKALLEKLEALLPAVRATGEAETALHQLRSLTSYLLKKKVWIFGGDGWAYDIGYGGLDHVVASDADVNILVLDTGVYSNTGGQKSKATPIGAVAKFAAAGKDIAKKDLGLMCMAYQSCYVAQVALGANPAHTLKALQAAASYPGPSLIIAYSTCIEHGFPMNKGWDHAKMAVDCGFWPLYTYDPRRIAEGKNPLELTTKEPKVPVADFIKFERRFMRLRDEDPARFEMLLKKAEEDIGRKFRYLKKLAEMDWSSEAPASGAAGAAQ